MGGRGAQNRSKNKTDGQTVWLGGVKGGSPYRLLIESQGISSYVKDMDRLKIENKPWYKQLCTEVLRKNVSE
ncbi:hypothetical protein D1869_12000 [Sulfurisphaera ohwakuensis]|uniref:Uncharacterized protein n=1 Tax=Sulfurisphaera ohwakuensis TaxID=69656 RepID=A0A650CJ69_SULOH|nr:hypothetical protein [Sulfurisphaera ohwakuensis]QGR17819.1 hypothetical protein D1869_12000 [Sulfurisphaera ohwakuensis]